MVPANFVCPSIFIRAPQACATSSTMCSWNLSRQVDKFLHGATLAEQMHRQQRFYVQTGFCIHCDTVANSARAR